MKPIARTWHRSLIAENATLAVMSPMLLKKWQKSKASLWKSFAELPQKMPFDFSEFLIDGTVGLCYYKKEVIELKQYAWITILILGILLNMACIFSQSLKSQEASNATSQTITEKIQPIVDPQNKIPPERFNHGLRKTAHVVEFAALGALLGLLFHQIGKLKKSRYISCPLLLTLLTAVADEWIQSFHDRGSQVVDILIDLGGGTLGIALIWIILILFTEEKTYGHQL